jgi:hypothetical protein
MEIVWIMPQGASGCSGIAPNAHTNQNENHWATGDLEMIQALTPTSLG